MHSLLLNSSLLVFENPVHSSCHVHRHSVIRLEKPWDASKSTRSSAASCHPTRSRSPSSTACGSSRPTMWSPNLASGTSFANCARSRRPQEKLLPSMWCVVDRRSSSSLEHCCRGMSRLIKWWTFIGKAMSRREAFGSALQSSCRALSLPWHSQLSSGTG